MLGVLEMEIYSYFCRSKWLC